MAIKSKKLQPDVQASFSLLSLGILTARDAWVYNSDLTLLQQSIEVLTTTYEQRRRSVLAGKMTLEQAGKSDAPTHIKWTHNLRERLRRLESLELQEDNFRQSMFRPFLKQQFYFDFRLIERVYRIPSMFPTPNAANLVIGFTGPGATTPLSALIANVIPDYELVSKAQWFSRWHYEAHEPDSLDAWVQSDDEGLEEVPGYRRVDNITNWCLQQFHAQYPDLQITKDDIWHYIYGLLHAPDYREKYRADLYKDLPRIPFAPDFGAFRDAGAELAALHLGYETCPKYELQVEVAPSPKPYQLSFQAMKWDGTGKELDRSVLHVTPSVTLSGIPDAAHGYMVNGRTPLEWAVDRLRVRQDNKSGIVNDPNTWFADDPAELVAHLKRLVHVSVESTRIVDGLPPALAD